MSAICYYSNFCEPSKKLLQLMAKTKLKNEIHFICIDQRSKDTRGQTLVEINGQRVVLPPAVTKVPALYLIDTRKALFEDDIYRFLAPQETAINHVETRGQGEPDCYSNQAANMSDSFSFWDQDAEELGTKGSGGMRQQHSYATVDQVFQIPTPEDTYEPDKVGAKGSKTLEEYKAERDMAVAAPIART
jgi:hypothetical protein